MKKHILFAALALVVPALLSCEKENSLIVYGEIGGHAYVDLGLRDDDGNRVLFATMNVGASSSEEYGDYFAWGETTKRYADIAGNNAIVGGSFEWSNCPYHTGYDMYSGWSKYIPAGKGSYSVSGITDNLLSLEASDDAAHVQWGNRWRMPNKSELEFLLSESVTREWVEDYNQTGVAGLLIRGRGAYTETSIFLPAGGKCIMTTWHPGYEHNGHYWSSEVDDFPGAAASLLFNDAGETMIFEDRYIGFNVRPVITVRLPEGNI